MATGRRFSTTGHRITCAAARCSYKRNETEARWLGKSPVATQRGLAKSYGQGGGGRNGVWENETVMSMSAGMVVWLIENADRYAVALMN